MRKISVPSVSLKMASPDENSPGTKSRNCDPADLNVTLPPPASSVMSPDASMIKAESRWRPENLITEWDYREITKNFLRKLSRKQTPWPSRETEEEAAKEESDAAKQKTAEVSGQLQAECEKQRKEAQMIAGIGGSDSHIVSHIGRCVTRFEDSVQSVEQLVSALQSGRFEAESWISKS